MGASGRTWRHPLREHLDGEVVGVARGNTRHLDRARGTAAESDRERRVVVVLDSLVHVGDLRMTVPRNRTDRSRSFTDHRTESPAADLGDRSPEEFGEVTGVAAHISECSRPLRSLESPADGGLGIGRIVGPVANADVVHLPEHAGLDQIANVGDSRRAAERESDPREVSPRGPRLPLLARRPTCRRAASHRARACLRRAIPRRSRDASVGHHDADHVDVAPRRWPATTYRGVRSRIASQPALRAARRHLRSRRGALAEECSRTRRVRCGRRRHGPCRPFPPR